MSRAAERFHAKRAAGISAVRSDGSLCTPETDTQAGEAEWWSMDQLGMACNEEAYPTHGDGGKDATLDLEIETIWLGMERDGVTPRIPARGHLIVNPHEPHRWGDIYLSVYGSTARGFAFAGWMTHKRLVTRGTRDFGYGPRFYWPASRLYSMDTFRELARRFTGGRK